MGTKIIFTKVYVGEFGKEKPNASKIKESIYQEFLFRKNVYTWNSKQPVLYGPGTGCFNWMVV